MIISGTLVPSDTATSKTPSNPTSGLSVGKVITGRVGQMGANGTGVLRFPDGSGFKFSGAPTLKSGEPVQLQVMRMQPNISFQLLASSSGVASTLAESAEQSLVRAPDIFSNLLNWSGLTTGSKPASSGGILPGTSDNNALFLALKSSTNAGTMVTGKEGKTLAQVLQNSLPNVSAQSLLKGEISGLVRLLEGGSRQDISEAIRQLRQAATGLRFAENPSNPQKITSKTQENSNATELNAARNTLNRLSDLLAMQEILPKAPLSTEGNLLLGYRLFWLTEGGLGEAIWQREKAKQGGKSSDEEDAVTSVLLSLNMTGLGSVQARLSYGEGQLMVGIAAEDEEALAALRGRIGDLRRGLIQKELPLRSLELSRLLAGEMKTERMQALGLSSHFSTEV